MGRNHDSDRSLEGLATARASLMDFLDTLTLPAHAPIRSQVVQISIMIGQILKDLEIRRIQSVGERSGNGRF